MTALELITAAGKRAECWAAGEVPTAEEATDGLARLNALIDQWKAERLVIYQTTRTTWTIAASDGQYTVGTGGDVNVDRPVYIQEVRYVQTDSDPDLERPLTMLTDHGWAAIAQKALTNTIPGFAYYNPTVPTGTLDLWPIPTSSTLTGVLYAPQPLAELAALTTTVTVPPAYRRMMETNLALEMAPEYGKQPHPVLVQAANDSLAVVKRANRRLSDLQIDPGALIGGQRHFNIWTGL